MIMKIIIIIKGGLRNIFISTFKVKISGLG